MLGDSLNKLIEHVPYRLMGPTLDLVRCVMRTERWVIHRMTMDAERLAGSAEGRAFLVAFCVEAVGGQNEHQG